MKISILTLFPDMFRGPFDESIVHRALQTEAVSIELVNIRDFSPDTYRSVDDHPYGGGQGMVMRVDVIDRAIQNAKCQMLNAKCKTVLLDPQGRVYSQSKAQEFSRIDHLILVCGHYEGVDERVRKLVDEEISIGDYVLTGGEIPAMVIVDSVTRLIPGVLKKDRATRDESFGGGAPILEYPQYTRPAVYKKRRVPAVLLSGNHRNIANWRLKQSLRRTKQRRPDLS